MYRVEPAQRNTVIVVIKADDRAGAKIAVAGSVVNRLGQRLIFAGLQIQNPGPGAVSLRRRNHHVQPFTGFINVHFIHSSLKTGAVVMKEDLIGGAFVNQVENGLAIIRAGAKMQPTKDVIVGAHIHLPEIVISPGEKTKVLNQLEDASGNIKGIELHSAVIVTREGVDDVRIEIGPNGTLPIWAPVSGKRVGQRFGIAHTKINRVKLLDDRFGIGALANQQFGVVAVERRPV